MVGAGYTLQADATEFDVYLEMGASADGWWPEPSQYAAYSVQMNGVETTLNLDVAGTVGDEEGPFSCANGAVIDVTDQVVVLHDQNEGSSSFWLGVLVLTDAEVPSTWDVTEIWDDSFQVDGD